MNLLKINNIKKSYNKGVLNEVLALNGINLEIEDEEFICLLGRSGSGKSTLVNIISGLLKPDSGEVILKGKNILNLSDVERALLRRKEVGHVFQDYKLITVLNVEQNIKLPCIEKDEKYFEFLVESLGLGDKLNSYPDELSGGQQQRVAIARALINKPELILADEPTGNLDSTTEKEVMQLLRKMNIKLGVTILLITHNDKLVEYGNRVIYLNDGMVIKDERFINRASI